MINNIYMFRHIIFVILIKYLILMINYALNLYISVFSFLIKYLILMINRKVLKENGFKKVPYKISHIND